MIAVYQTSTKKSAPADIFALARHANANIGVPMRIRTSISASGGLRSIH